MTYEEQATALRHWGYTPREAGFLVYAALASGYFLRRQFEAAGASGSQIVRLLDKLLWRGHARQLRAGRCTIFHLDYAPMYRALGEPGNRNRRSHGPRDIKMRLMSLDFLIGRKERALLTMPDKMAHLATAGIGPEYYPQYIRGNEPVRYFNGCHPVTVSDSGKLTFAYVDGGAESVKGFDTWLRRHLSMFSRLPAFGVAYVCCFPDLVPYMRHSFDQAIVGHRTGDYDDQAQALLAYFSQRRDIEQGKTTGFDRASLDLFRKHKESFAGDEFESLYVRWRDEGSLCLGRAAGVSFSGEVLPWDYAALSGATRLTRQLHATNATPVTPRPIGYADEGRNS